MAGHKPPRAEGIGTRRRDKGVAPRRRSVRRGGATSLIAAASQDLTDEASWFERPWRDGRNVVRLLETLNILADGNPLPWALNIALAKTPDTATAADYAAIDALAVETT